MKARSRWFWGDYNAQWWRVLERIKVVSISDMRKSYDLFSRELSKFGNWKWISKKLEANEIVFMDLYRLPTSLLSSVAFPQFLGIFISPSRSDHVFFFGKPMMKNLPNIAKESKSFVGWSVKINFHGHRTRVSSMSKRSLRWFSWLFVILAPRSWTFVNLKTPTGLFKRFIWKKWMDDEGH